MRVARAPLAVGGRSGAAAAPVFDLALTVAAPIADTAAAMAPALLDRFIPAPAVRERFEITVGAPPARVMQVAAGFDMQSAPAVRAIFRLREVLLGAAWHEARRPQGIVEETLSLGWGLLDEEAGRYLVCGASCQPWLAEVRFTAIDRERFAAWCEPDNVKIAWTLEAEEIAPNVTRLAQETRAVATDAEAAAKFRRYWRWARFGIVAIRLLLLPAVRREAERRQGVHDVPRADEAEAGRLRREPQEEQP